MSFETALTQIAPDVVLMHPFMLRSLATADESEPVSPPRAEQFWAFMRAHRAHVIGELRDYEGAPVQIYQLDW